MTLGTRVLVGLWLLIAVAVGFGAGRFWSDARASTEWMASLREMNAARDVAAQEWRDARAQREAFHTALGQVQRWIDHQPALCGWRRDEAWDR